MANVTVIKIYPHLFGANTYILTNDNKNAIVVDPSRPSILEELSSRNLTAKYVLLTHSHFDHIGGVSALQNAGAKVVCAEEERAAFNTTMEFGARLGYKKEPLIVDETFSGEKELNFLGISLKVIQTPGHTIGSVCYLLKEENILFTGDTLFEGSIGRTDLPTGDTGMLRESLRKLKNLSGDYDVYSGHGDETTLDRERRLNPFFIDA